MRAIAIDRYGPPEHLRVREMDQPRCGSQQVRIRVAAAGVNPIDYRIRAGQMKFLLPLRLPLILGFDVAGTIESVGEGVQSFTVGDEVFCFLDGLRPGGYAEFAVASAKVVVKKPPNISMEEAAATPLAALTALQSLRRLGKVQHGSSVLINGASGGVGTFSVQIAKILGGHVTGVCSEQNTELVRELGADRVIDYRTEDFTKGDEKYDVVFDAVSKRSYLDARNVLKKHGAYIRTVPSWDSVLHQAISWTGLGQRSYNMLAKSNGDDLRDVAQWITEGRVRVIIDKVFPFDQAAEAHHYLEQGHARGKVVLQSGS